MSKWFSSSERGAGGFASERTVTALVFGIAIGMAAMLLVWRLMPDATGAGTHDTGARGAPSDGAAPSSTPGPGTTASASQSSDGAVARCGHVYAAQGPPLHAAASAMAQWQLHIGAMNKLVLGVISLPQANQFWNRTRVGAAARLRAYAAAKDHLNQLTVRCPRPGGPSAPPALRRCERAVAADWRVLGLADTALATWHRHVRDMEMLRMGTMSPARATQMWLQSWHEGQREVTRYRAAVTATRSAHCAA